MKTVFSDTPHASATSATRTASNPRSRNMRVAVSDSSWRISRFFRSRRPSPGPAGMSGVSAAVDPSVGVLMTTV